MRKSAAMPLEGFDPATVTAAQVWPAILTRSVPDHGRPSPVGTQVQHSPGSRLSAPVSARRRPSPSSLNPGIRPAPAFVQVPSSPMSSLRQLQLLTTLLAFVPIVTGLLTLLGVHDPLYRDLDLPPEPLLDSNLRFFGGVWLGLGVAVLWLVPRLARETVLFRALWGMIFLGGIGRLISALAVGWPPLPFIGFTALEIVGAPLFVWQARVASVSR